MRTATMVCFFLAILLVASMPVSASANPGWYDIVWYDDMEGDVSEWYSEDLTASIAPEFHIDTYLAFDDPARDEDHSWWCGRIDSEFAGGDGYGNSWDQRLELPPVHLGSSVVEEMNWGAIKALYRDGPDDGGDEEVPTASRPAISPVLTYRYRYDSEVGYDHTYVQVQNGEGWENLNNGYEGSSGGWQDIGAYGYVLSDYGDPVLVRFQFVSDGAYSDEDGLYDSDGGAFHVDNIRIFDFYGGETYFYDDVEGGSPCQPIVPGAAGDYWHLIDRPCPAISDPHCWWCGDDADTSLVPPNLVNALYSPVITGNFSSPCTLFMAVHQEIPTVDNDYYRHDISLDGGEWYGLSAWWGDFEMCDGWGTAGLNGFAVPAGWFSSIQYRMVVHTTDNGCGPGVAGGAGVFLDDIWLGVTSWIDEPDRQAVSARESAEKARRRGLANAIPESPYRMF